MSTNEDIGAEITAELVKKTKLEEALQAGVRYLRPSVSRGPNSEHWVETMKLVADALDWPTCKVCGGAGEIVKPGRHVDVITGKVIKNPQPFTKLCAPCLGIGKADSDG